MTISYETGDGADALYWNQIQAAFANTYWVGGWDASPGANAMEVDVAAGDGEVGGAGVSTGSTSTVTLAAADSDPRKDTIYVDGTGTVQVVTGTPAPAAPTGEVRDNTWSPSPPIPGSDGVVVAEVWVPAGASDITASDVIDRRLGFGALAEASGITFIQNSEPSYTEGASWVNPDTGVLSVGYDGGEGGDYHPVPPVTVLDEATAFNGSDGETLTHNGTTVSGGSVELGAGAKETTTDDYSPSGSFSTSSWYGRQINTNKPLAGIGATLEDGMGTANEARLLDSNGNLIQSWSVNVSGGQSFYQLLDTPLADETTYFIEVRNSGGMTHTYGGDGEGATGSALDILAASGSGAVTSQDRALEAVSGGPAVNSGDVIIAWGTPADIRGWDLATFQSTLDGETVTVDVLDGSNTLLFSDISQNFDISTVPASTEVKIRANLSRTDAANNPTLDYAARRFLR